MHASYPGVFFRCLKRQTLDFSLPPIPVRDPIDPQSRFAQSARVPGPADKWHPTNRVSPFLVLGKRAVDPY